ncbi:MAG: peroxide stress protein YaaA [Flavobacteriaceae bacterium]|nr:peroxide stress protein YaaA [Flavobacteriaceae bacterium]
MKLVISPAKSLNYDSKLPTGFSSESCFLNEAKELNTLLKKKSPKALSELMHISPKLGALNYERNQNWSLPFSSENARQAIYAFDGDVYRGLDAYSISEDKLDTLQDTVRIISGLYGLLKPLDLIQPYRLEMGTKFPVGKNKNLYEFWRKKITTALNDELHEDELLVNLASQEYFKAIDAKALKATLIHVDFKEFKNGQFKTIAIFSKRARGLMTRYIIDSNAQTAEELKSFNIDRYAYDANLSSDHKLVFTR